MGETQTLVNSVAYHSYVANSNALRHAFVNNAKYGEGGRGNQLGDAKHRVSTIAGSSSTLLSKRHEKMLQIFPHKVQNYKKFKTLQAY